MTQPITEPIALRALDLLGLPDNLMVAVLTSDLRIETASPAFCRFFGCDSQALANMPLSDALPEVAGVEDAVRAVSSGETPSFEIRRITREADDGRTAFARLLIAPRDPKRLSDGLLALATDTSETGLLERALTHQRSDILLMQQELMIAADELRARNQELDSFNFTVAHDLKAPLMVISGYTGVIRADMKGGLSERATRALQQIESTAYMMSAIIHNLLLLAHLRDATEVIERVEMKPVIDSALARLARVIEERGVKVEVTADLPPVMGYGPWIEEAFANLVENAIKYIGADNPDPRVAILTRVENGDALYGVQDNGIGITPENQSRLFDMFSRFNVDQAEGFGLGLPIVARILTKLNGAITVSSEVGKGSVFWARLKRAI